MLRLDLSPAHVRMGGRRCTVRKSVNNFPEVNLLGIDTQRTFGMTGMDLNWESLQTTFHFPGDAGASTRSNDPATVLLLDTSSSDRNLGYRVIRHMVSPFDFKSLLDLSI